MGVAQDVGGGHKLEARPDVLTGGADVVSLHRPLGAPQHHGVEPEAQGAGGGAEGAGGEGRPRHQDEEVTLSPTILFSMQ